MRITVAALALCIALAPLAASAEPLAGTVIDRQSKRPIAGATVTATFASGPSVSTTTDEGGRFAFELAATPVSFSVRRMYYEAFDIAAVTAGADPLHLTFALSPLLSMISSHAGFRSANACEAFQWHGQTYNRQVVEFGHCGVSPHH
jgi:hypothetical protein